MIGRLMESDLLMEKQKMRDQLKIQYFYLILLMEMSLPIE